MKCTAIIHSWWLNWVGREAGFEPLVFAGMGVCDGGPVCTGEDWWETSYCTACLKQKEERVRHLLNNRLTKQDRLSHTNALAQIGRAHV